MFDRSHLITVLQGGFLGAVFLAGGIASGLGHCDDPDTSWTRTESAVAFGSIGVAILAWTIFQWVSHEKRAAQQLAALHDDPPVLVAAGDSTAQPVPAPRAEAERNA